MGYVKVMNGQTVRFNLIGLDAVSFGNMVDFTPWYKYTFDIKFTTYKVLLVVI